MLEIKDQDTKITNEIWAGIIVSIALIPEIISFALLLGVSPIVALYSGAIIAMIMALFGGRSIMVSAAAGSVAVIFIPLVQNYGVGYLFYAIILMGLFQIIFAFLNIDYLFKLISKPIMLSFVNGLAIIILFAQVRQFKVPGTQEWLIGKDLWIMFGLTILTILIIKQIPKIIKKIPATLMALLIITLISLVLDYSGVHIYNVMDMTKNGATNIDKHAPLNLTTLQIVFIPALSAALVAIVESLLTLNLIDDLTNTKGEKKKEVYALGSANLLSGLLGGVGGCGMIGQTMINYSNGAKKKLSSFIAGLALLVFILFFKNIIGMIPLAALVGIMLIVVYNTFDLELINLYKKGYYFDFFLVIVTTIIIVITSNLALGVVIGVIVTMLNYTLKKIKYFNCEIVTNDKEIILNINEDIFFGSSEKFLIYLDEIEKQSILNNNDIIINFNNHNIIDYSTLMIFKKFILKMEQKKIKLKVNES